MSRQAKAVKQLRELLNSDKFIIMPCCYDGLSAKLTGQSGFEVTFMSGFGVSAARLGLPDTGLISYAEMADQAQNVCNATDIPVICDGDTGYGNPVNIKRTVHGYIRAGAAGIMIEDQVSPKRCGHTRGKAVVDRDTAFNRIKAATEARNEARQNNEDIVLMARTDALATLGLDEALFRAETFINLGADIIFVEAPRNKKEMKIIAKLGGCQMANIVEHGVTPVLPPKELASMGYRIAAYPLTLLSAATYAMKKALDCLKKGEIPEEILEFTELQSIVGFPEYDKTLKRLS
ncbi:MAG: isocitrate lyase/PEP mutase family protein [Proteobacteria bacterium]|nr:isocitrate lyase/PEP mutase family protein [Pseudomonadota bacterium]